MKAWKRKVCGVVCALLFCISPVSAFAADVTISGLTIRDVEFDGASGICTFEDCQIEKLDMDTASGDIHFSGTLESLDCDSVSADCHIEVANAPRSIRIDGLSGDLTLILPEDAGFTCELDAMSSSFDTDFDFRTYEDHYICGNGDCHYGCQCCSHYFVECVLPQPAGYRSGFGHHWIFGLPQLYVCSYS